jgi:hypothetical protein
MVAGINSLIYYANQIFGAAYFATEGSRTTVTRLGYCVYVPEAKGQSLEQIQQIWT